MILNRQRRVRVDTKPLEEFLARVQEALRLGKRDVTVCLVSDAAIAELNETFRGKLAPTDVLAFPANGRTPRQGSIEAGKPARRIASEAQRAQRERRAANGAGVMSFASSTSFTSSGPYLGDIAISPETARRNARRFSRSLPDELRILILHGVLHLAGHDHETDHGEMNRLEHRLRRRLGLS